jgi:hypothetical protein
MKTPARVAAVAATAALALAATTVPALASLSPAPVVPVNQSGVVVGWPAPNTTPDEITVPDSLKDRALTSIAASSGRAVAVTADGHVVSWGRSDALFYGAHATVQPAGLDHVASVAIMGNNGQGNILALRSDGTVVAWGSTRTGVNDVPSDLSGVVSIALGPYEAFAVKSDGTVVAWGSVLADPPPAGLTGVASISVSPAGGEVLALTSDHNVVAWGSGGNAYGQQSVPADIQGRVMAVRATEQIGLALLTDGSLREWGNADTLGAPLPPAPTVGDPYVDADLDGSGCGIAATQAGHVVTWGQSTCPRTPPASLADQHTVAVAFEVGNGAALALVSAFAVAAPPAITGTAQVGQTLTLTPARFSVDPDGASATQWRADGNPITGATGDTLALTDALTGKTITATQTATKDGRSVTATSDPVGPVKAATSLRATASTTAYGTRATITVTASPATATGTIQVKNGSAVIGTATLAGGRAAVSIPGTTFAPGAHTLTVAYTGDSNDAPATTTAALTVVKASPSLAVKVSPKKLTKATLKKAKAKVTVTAAGYVPTGTVQIYLKNKRLAAATLSNGQATLKLKKLKKLAKNKKKLKLQIRYGGDGTTNTATTNTTIKLKH